MGCDDKQLVEKVAEGVAKALQEKKVEDDYNEWAKQYPKVTSKMTTEGVGWRVGDWYVSNGVVYEITGAAETSTEYVNNSWSTRYHLKLKTLPIKGQRAVEGWISIGQHTPQHVILNRTLPGIKLTKESPLDNS